MSFTKTAKRLQQYKMETAKTRDSKQTTESQETAAIQDGDRQKTLNRLQSTESQETDMS